MIPLSLDDLLPLEEFAGRRREFFASHCRYLDRYRRLRVGPAATLLFENRQTLWFRIQEVFRIARLREARLIQAELDLYNRLLPGPGQLQAALLIDVGDETRWAEQLAPWASLADGQVRFCLGKQAFGGCLLTCRPEDRCTGTAHWVQFAIHGEALPSLADMTQPAHVEIGLAGYAHRSAELSEEMRQSLLDDLKPASGPLAA